MLPWMAAKSAFDLALAVQGLAVRFGLDVLSLRVGLFYRFVLPSLAFFDASPWHYESLFEGRKN